MTFPAYGRPGAWVASLPDMGALMPISLCWVEHRYVVVRGASTVMHQGVPRQRAETRLTPSSKRKAVFSMYLSHLSMKISCLHSPERAQNVSIYHCGCKLADLSV